MKALLYLLTILSLALNVALLTGCASLRDSLCGLLHCNQLSSSPVKDDGREKLAAIASLVGIETEGKSAADLESDLRIVLDRTEVVPAPYDEEAFEAMAKDLNTAEEEAMREYHDFVLRLQGKRVIAIAPDN
jgi:hypothetical protein